jgi:hypothetical protein
MKNGPRTRLYISGVNRLGVAERKDTPLASGYTAFPDEASHAHAASPDFLNGLRNSWIGGKLHPSSLYSLQHKAPHNGVSTGDTDDAREECVDAAVANARQGFKLWARLPQPERQRLLVAFADKIEASAALLAALEGLEVGIVEVLIISRKRIGLEHAAIFRAPQAVRAGGRWGVTRNEGVHVGAIGVVLALSKPQP